MYDASSQFDIFYRDHVVLPQENQNELYSKKEINIKRLKKGLEEYNEEHSTNFQLIESAVQGSVAMSTVIQNDSNDYDIDVGIVFADEVMKNVGAQASRNMVADALRREATQFNARPEVKTGCVRIQYADGYHIDFAVYRKQQLPEWDGQKYYHAGADWAPRQLKDLTDWFSKKNNESNELLRKIVRLSKMFCRSREKWDMPSGLLQTVVCAECLSGFSNRLDENFYYSMKAIVNRLENSLQVAAPVDNGRDLTPRKSDIKRMENWKNRLKSKLDDLSVLFDSDCSFQDAMQAWGGFFYHTYWLSRNSSGDQERSFLNPTSMSFLDEEEFIEDKFSAVDIKYQVSIDCVVEMNGFQNHPLTDFLKTGKRIIPGKNTHIICKMKWTNCPGDYDVYWKVKNVGPEAERRNQLRGQILNRGRTISEPASFFGNHYIECYIVKNDVCVANKKVIVPIERGRSA